jgi:hypothetical protein
LEKLRIAEFSKGKFAIAVIVSLLTFAELSDPKLLQPAAQSGAESQDQNNTREGSMLEILHLTAQRVGEASDR